MLRNYANKLDDCIPNKLGCYRLIYFLKPLVLMPISHSPSACSALGFCRRSSPTGGNRFVLGFDQLVAPRQSCLRSVVVCCANYCLCVTIVLENKFLPHCFPISTIFDCNSPTSVASQLLRPFEPKCYSPYSPYSPYNPYRPYIKRKKLKFFRFPFSVFRFFCIFVVYEQREIDIPNQ